MNLYHQRTPLSLGVLLTEVFGSHVLRYQPAIGGGKKKKKYLLTFMLVSDEIALAIIFGSR